MSKLGNRLDTAVAIQEWQSSHQPDPSKPEDRSVTTRLGGGILDLFREALGQLAQPQHAETVPKPIRISLERARGLVALWSDGYGIQDGKLDDTLAKSRNLRRSTLKTLSSIASTLLGRLIPLAHLSSDKLAILTVQLAATVDEASYIIHDAVRDESDDHSDTSSDTSSDAGPDDNLAEVAEDLKTDAQCLMDLDPLFRDPVLDLASHKQKQHLETTDWTPETAFCDKVQQRFPTADATLVETLGKANWARFLRCQAIRNKAEAETFAQDTVSGDKDEGATVAASSKFHDSGLGTSLPTAGSYAETLMTYGAGDGQKVRIPRLSEEAKMGTPFPCLACGRSVRIADNSTWKRHLYLDLQPYMCLEPGCSKHRFLNRADWVAHLAFDHFHNSSWDAIRCPLCLETTERGKIGVTAHLARHLEEISLSALPAYPDEDDDESFETDSDSSIEASRLILEFNKRNQGDAGDEKFAVRRCSCRAGEPGPIEVNSSADNGDDSECFFLKCDGCKNWQHWGRVLSSPSMILDKYYCESCRLDDSARYQHADGSWSSRYPRRPTQLSPDEPHNRRAIWGYASPDGRTSPIDKAEADRKALAEAELRALFGNDEDPLRQALDEADREALLEEADQEATRKQFLEEEQAEATIAAILEDAVELHEQGEPLDEAHHMALLAEAAKARIRGVPLDEAHRQILLEEAAKLHARGESLHKEHRRLLLLEARQKALREQLLREAQEEGSSETLRMEDKRLLDQAWERRRDEAKAQQQTSGGIPDDRDNIPEEITVAQSLEGEAQDTARGEAGGPDKEGDGLNWYAWIHQ